MNAMTRFLLVIVSFWVGYSAGHYVGQAKDPAPLEPGDRTTVPGSVLRCYFEKEK